MDLAIWMSQVILSKEDLVMQDRKQIDAEQEANRILRADYFPEAWLVTKGVKLDDKFQGED